MLLGLLFRKSSFNLLLVLSFLNKLSLCLTTCNIITCNRRVENLLSHTREDGTETLSRHIKDFLKCVGECYHALFPNFIPKFEDSLNMSEKIFSSDPIFYLNYNWECVAQNSVSLITCLAVTQSMKTSTLNDKASRLLACKKATAILNCPQETLFEKCGETTADAMDEIFNTALKSEVESTCQEVSSGALSSLHTYNKLGNKFMKMAACVDIKKTILKNCLQEFLTDSYAVRKYMCCEYGDLIKCMTRDSDECVSHLTSVSFFRSVLSLGEDKCDSVEECPKDKNGENDFNLEHSNIADSVETPTQEASLLSFGILAAGPWEKENVSTPVTKYVQTIHENASQPLIADTVLSSTAFALNEDEREEKKAEGTIRITFPSKQGTGTKTERENTIFTSTSVSNVPHGELVSRRTIPSPCVKVKVDLILFLLLLSITIFH
ncbi:uncharacterized protein LOC129217229 [Uloborus diversus]|uniref:uncharacterized protein LOC129217229 n=1 Tax=Uloborus diversus TaxID=327109 RepID=UPI00240A4237|nr:uncharacterized protein LOC129217229 [Uloborus diversus]